MTVPAAVAAQALASDDARAAAARRLASSSPRPVLDRLCALAARLLSAGSAQVSLLGEVQVVEAGSGVAASRTSGPLQDSLCTVTAAAAEPLLVDDAARDVRVRDLPPVRDGVVGSYLGAPLVDASGHVVGAFCVYGDQPRSWTPTDVALVEQLAAAVMSELELTALSEEYDTERVRWELAVDAAGIGSFDWDLVTGALAWDDRMFVLFGYEPGQFEPTIDSAFTRIHPDDRASVDAAIDAAVACCGHYRAEFRIVLAGGAVRWVAARGRAVAAVDGRAARLIGTAQDVTEVRTGRDEAARLLDGLAVGFVALDRDWAVTYINDAGQTVVGRRADELLGRSFWDLFPGLDELPFGPAYRHAVATGETVDVEAFYAHLDAWYLVRAVPSADGLSLYFSDISARHADQEAARRAGARVALLAEVGRVLADPDDVGSGVTELAGALVPELADWSLVLVQDQQGWHQAGSAHRDPALAPAVQQLADLAVRQHTEDSMLSRAVRQSGPALRTEFAADWLDAADLPEDLREALAPLQPGNALVVPILGRQGALGAVSLVRLPGRPGFDADEVATAVEVGRRAGVALENARLLRGQRRLAETLQNSLLSDPPAVPGVEVAVRYQAAAPDAAVGGDWYDAFVLPDGATALVVGDVSGHDQDAAAAMGQIRALLRATAYAIDKPPALILHALDTAMAGLAVGSLATCVLARLVATEGVPGRRLTWSNAGHPPPLLVGPDGRARLLGSDPDLLLGFGGAADRADHTVDLLPGTTLLFFTDGLVERRGEDLDTGLDRLVSAATRLAGLGVEGLCDALLVDLARRADDDVALLAVRVTH